MSAFICDERIFTNIYTGMKVYGNSNVDWYAPIRYFMRKLLNRYGTLENIIEQLYALNVRAVNQRYQEETDERISKQIINMNRTYPPSLFQFLKSLECLRYQMSEENVPEEELYKLLSELIGQVALSIAYMDSRYSEAEWG